MNKGKREKIEPGNREKSWRRSNFVKIKNNALYGTVSIRYIEN